MQSCVDSARGPQRFVTVFEKQTPYNMKLVAVVVVIVVVVVVVVVVLLVMVIAVVVEVVVVIPATICAVSQDVVDRQANLLDSNAAALGWWPMKHE